MPYIACEHTTSVPPRSPSRYRVTSDERRLRATYFPKRSGTRQGIDNWCQVEQTLEQHRVDLSGVAEEDVDGRGEETEPGRESNLQRRGDQQNPQTRQLQLAGDTKHDQEKVQGDHLVEQRGEDHSSHQNPGRKGHLLHQRGISGDCGGGADDPLLHRHPLQQTAEENDREIFGSFVDARGHLYDRAEKDREEGEALQRLNEGPQENHHRAGVAALEIAASEFAEQEK